jgi:hypothetical protein
MLGSWKQRRSLTGTGRALAVAVIGNWKREKSSKPRRERLLWLTLYRFSLNERPVMLLGAPKRLDRNPPKREVDLKLPVSRLDLRFVMDRM